MKIEQTNIEYSVEDLAMFEGYISKNRILIVEQSRPGGLRLRDIFISFGAKAKNIFLTDNFDIAKEYLLDKMPGIVISGYGFNKKFAFDLPYKRDRNRLFMIVSNDNKQNKIARSCENGIDAYIIKPYTNDDIKKIILSSAKQLTNPDLMQKITNEGIIFFEQKKYEDAKKKFQQVLEKESDSPIASFYLGKIYQDEKNLIEAEKCYRMGLVASSVHYKSLSSMYQLLLDNKQIVSSFDMLKRLIEYFPENSTRFNSALRLSIVTENYDFIHDLFEKYQTLEIQTDEMKKYVAAALVIMGTNYLTQNKITRAVEAFGHAAQISLNNVLILRKIIEVLTDYNMAKEIQEYFNNFTEDDKFGPDYRVCEFFVSCFFDSKENSIQKGEYIIKSMKVINSQIYKLMYQKYMAVHDQQGLDWIKGLIVKDFPEKFRFKKVDALS